MDILFKNKAKVNTIEIISIKRNVPLDQYSSDLYMNLINMINVEILLSLRDGKYWFIKFNYAFYLGPPNND